MKIVDLDGNTITVTDWPESMAQVEIYVGYMYKSGTSEDFVQMRRRYLKDLHEKLVNLKAKQNNGNHGSK